MTRAALLALSGLALLAGCAELDPYQRPGMWQPSGAPAGNLAAMAAEPRDLIRGRSDRSGLRHEGGDAVQRLWDDHPKPLIGSTPAAPPGLGAAPGPAPGGAPPAPAPAPSPAPGQS